MKKLEEFVVFVSFFTLTLITIAAEDILGCGGFVKSDIGINFSLVEIKLYTKQGTLKYQTDCAPNNGYYLIPLYDKGDYILKVEPPSGWSFEPSSINLHIDGSTDLCSKGKDINFHFKGFTISGKVISRGSTTGPAGVSVLLKAVNQDAAFQEVTTGDGGAYTFTKVMPGDYQVIGNHPVWTLVQSRVNVQVTKDNVNVRENLVIAGYDVSGQVTSEGDPIRGVHFLLFSEKKKQEEIEGCDKTELTGYVDPKNRQVLCHVTSQEDGIFRFSLLTPGDYTLVPFYKDQNIKFDVSPSELKFTIQHDSLILNESFKVQGFSVSGRVVASVGGRGVANAKVFLDKQLATETQADGEFHLENMKAGSYTLDVVAENMKFNTTTVKITPNTPHLSEIVVYTFNVCGKLHVSQMPIGMDVNALRSVVFIPQNNPQQGVLTRTDRNGGFCIQLTSGTYDVQPVVAETESQVGLKFQPSVKRIIVKDSPILNVSFKQFFAKISGVMKCQQPCVGVQVNLYMLTQGKEQKPLAFALVKENRFMFEEVLPGKYEVIVSKDDWCWASKKHSVTVGEKDITNIEFQHTGYFMAVVSSHETEIQYTSAGNSGTLTAKKGTGKLCISKPGSYEIVPIGCHGFSENNYKFDTARPSVISLVATRHLLTGTIFCDTNISDLTVSVKIINTISGEKSDEKIITLTKAENPNSSRDFKYIINYWSEPGVKLEFTPSSGKLLFTPPSKEFITVDDCMHNVLEFVGRKGLFIIGQIHPSLENVKITIFNEDNSDEPIFLESNREGKYIAGPLHSHGKYRVTAEKTGYIFTALDKQGHFEAYKLAEIIVKVVNTEGQSLPGVLLSLSGGVDYRQNSLTQENGTLQFSNLSPGQYFLRPMLKEYSFQPVSKMVDVKEGATEHITLRGTRVAFSCFGSVTSLSGESEPGIVIEAMGRGDCSQYQEEAVSEVEGTFRIRGLLPKCEYEVRLRKTPDANQHIERATPAKKIIKIEKGDIEHLRIIVFRYFSQMDISGNIVTSTDYLNSLKIRLFRDDSPEQALHTLGLFQSSFFQLPSLPLDDRTYTLRLETTLSRVAYDYELPQVTLKANTSYRHVTLAFSPRVRSTDHDVNQGSLLAFPVAILVLIVACNYSRMIPLMNQANDIIQTIINPARNNDSNGTDTAERRKKAKPRKTS